MRLLGFHYFVKKSKNVKLIQNQAEMFMKCRNTRNSETGGRELKKRKMSKK